MTILNFFAAVLLVISSIGSHAQSDHEAFDGWCRYIKSRAQCCGAGNCGWDPYTQKCHHGNGCTSEAGTDVEIVDEDISCSEDDG